MKLTLVLFGPFACGFVDRRDVAHDQAKKSAAEADAAAEARSTAIKRYRAVQRQAKQRASQQYSMPDTPR
jgi:hypothetical protein